MGLFGNTKASAYINFTNQISSSHAANCTQSDSNNAIGKIKVAGISLSGDCQLGDIDIGKITVNKDLKCSFKDVSDYTIEQVTDQSTEATGTGFQLGDITSESRADFKTQVSSFLDQKCGGSYDSNEIQDIEFGMLECKDKASLNKFDFGVIAVDQKTNCMFDNLYKLSEKTTLTQDSTSKQDILGPLLMLLLMMALPVILPMLGLKSVLKNPFFILIFLVLIFKLVLYMDCKLNWIKLCKSMNGKEKTVQSGMNIGVIVLFVLFLASVIKKKKIKKKIKPNVSVK